MSENYEKLQKRHEDFKLKVKKQYVLHNVGNTDQKHAAKWPVIPIYYWYIHNKSLEE